MHQAVTQDIDYVLRWWNPILYLEVETRAWTSQATTCGHCPIVSCYTGCYCREELGSVIFMTSLPVAAGCSSVSTDPPFLWTRKAWLLHALSTGRMPLTMTVASAGLSQVSPNSSRAEDPATGPGMPSIALSAPHRWWQLSLHLLATLLLMYTSLWFTLFAKRAHIYLSIQCGVHCNF